MRKVLIAAAFTAAFIVDANALEQGGIIVSVDRASKTFTVHWATADRIYKATERTVFRFGQQKGTWFDLNVGTTVNVGYHPVGKDRVAYRVEIVP